MSTVSLELLTPTEETHGCNVLDRALKIDCFGGGFAVAVWTDFVRYRNLSPWIEILPLLHSRIRCGQDEGLATVAVNGHAVHDKCTHPEHPLASCLFHDSEVNLALALYLVPLVR